MSKKIDISKLRPYIDKGIWPIVKVFNDKGIHTMFSCEGHNTKEGLIPGIPYVAIDIGVYRKVSKRINKFIELNWNSGVSTLFTNCGYDLDTLKIALITFNTKDLTLNQWANRLQGEL